MDSRYTSCMNKQELMRVVKGLDLDPASFIVVGSGVLAALELREAGDVDVIVSPETFQRFEANPAWQRKTFDDGNYSLVRGGCELMLDWGSPDKKPNLQDLKQDECTLNGIPFISPSRLLAWKERARRPKDLKDIEILRTYLS